MSRTKIVAANWKMNLTRNEAEYLINEILKGLPADLKCEVIIAPPFVYLQEILSLVNESVISIAAQHCHHASSGAYTGEVSVEMLKSVGATFCITGHSERRQLFHESNEMIKAKVDAILKGGLTPIFCCGESLEIRQTGQQNSFVSLQLEESVFHLEPAVFEQILIAYEPIWAIGTGVTASPGQAQEMHKFLREAIRAQYGNDISRDIRILYGGSIKGDNALSLFTQPDVDGGLVGGASLQSRGFLEIIRAACG